MSRRRRSQELGLDDRTWIRGVEVSLQKMTKRGKVITIATVQYGKDELVESLAEIHCNPGSEFTRMDIMKIVHDLGTRGRSRFQLGLSYPPPCVATAWSRARHRVDEWLKYDLVDELKREKFQPPPEVPEAPTVAEAWKGYWKIQSGPNSSLEALGTKKSQAGYWANWIKPHFGNLRTDEVRPAALEEWKGFMAGKMKPNTVLLPWRLFKRFYGWLREQDEADMFMGKPASRLRNGISPFKLVRNPKRPPRKERRTFSKEEMLSLLTACKHNDPTLLPIMVTAICTGMRIGEILGLKWQDVFLSDENGPGFLKVRGIIVKFEGYVKRAKTENGLRDVPMSSVLQDTLVEFRKSGLSIVEIEEKLDEVKKLRRQKKRVPKHLRLKPRPIVRGQQQEDFIFINYAKNNHLEYGNVRDRLLKIKQYAGIEHIEGEGWHEFRHAFISWAMKRKVDIKHLQLSVGHSDMKTTLAYTHLVGADSSWVNDLYDFGDHPVVNLGEKAVNAEEKNTPEIIDVEVEEMAADGHQLVTTPFVPVVNSLGLQSMTAFIEKTKESGWVTVEPRHISEIADDFQFANRFLWHIQLVFEDYVSRPILLPVSRGES